MSPSELRRTLRRTDKVYCVRVGDQCSLWPDLTLITGNRSRAERRHASYLADGLPSQLTVRLN